jgi:Zn ribbon nucleic-acid-binding protein
LACAESSEVDRVTVECLGCGERRRVDDDGSGLEAGECARCGYVGWATPADLSELVRRALREFPPERRRLRPI